MKKPQTKKSDTRPVDKAMVSARIQKQVIRSLWIAKAENYYRESPTEDYVLYLTLSGAAGEDIQILIDKGIIQLTETNSISPESQTKVVAVESNKQAVLNLQKQFPGLKIFEFNFANLVHGSNPTRFPTGEDERFCKARVINLDLNSILIAEEKDTEIEFPVLTWISKLGIIHKGDQQRNWSLYLTLHGEINWSKNVNNSIQMFLAENFKFVCDFGNSSKSLLGDKLYNEISAENNVKFKDLSREEKQKLLMIFVPKKIAQLLQSQGWQIITKENLRYGRSDQAPMVTWIFDFSADPRATSNPQALYRDNLLHILTSMGHVSSKGSIKRDAE